MEEADGIERRLLASACAGSDIGPDLIEELVEFERDNERRLRRRGLFAALRGSIENYSRELRDDSHETFSEER
jgi:hypothetical protein